MTDDILKDLAQFTGTETWHRHGLYPCILYTDGAKYVADQAGAYWLLDEIALSQWTELRVAAAAFQCWKLKVEGSQATLICEDGDDREIFRKAIPFTDFPATGIIFWFTDSVILLPSEY